MLVCSMSPRSCSWSIWHLQNGVIRAWAILRDLQIIRETLPAPTSPTSACGFPDAPAQSGSYRAQPPVAYTSCVAGIHPYYWVPSGKLTNCAAKNHNVNGQNQRTKWATFKSYFDITRGYLKMGIDPPLWRFSWGNWWEYEIRGTPWAHLTWI